ncbi:hypothetical protein L1887_57949 [Cichorium endivia]|nr:hypothetical protein L1887_57949 [Cichorium endivia]
MHDNVDLHNVARAGAVGTHTLDRLDLVAEQRRIVRDQLQKVGRRSTARQRLELAKRGARPGDNDGHRDDERTRRVDPPGNRRTRRGGEDTKAVDEQVVAVVLIEHLDLRRVLAQSIAVDRQDRLGDKGDADGNERGDEELLVAIARGEFLDGLDHEDGRDHAHERRIGDVADRLEARAADGPLSLVDLLALAMQPVEHEVGKRIEHRVRRGGKERERERAHGGIQLEDGEHKVGADRRVHGDLDLERRRLAVLLVLVGVRGDGLEQSLDVLVLRLVKVADLALVAAVAALARVASTHLGLFDDARTQQQRVGLSAGRGGCKAAVAERAGARTRRACRRLGILRGVGEVRGLAVRRWTGSFGRGGGGGEGSARGRGRVGMVLVGVVEGGAALGTRVGGRGAGADVDVDGDVVAEVVAVGLEVRRHGRVGSGSGAARGTGGRGSGSGELDVLFTDGREGRRETRLVVRGVVGGGGRAERLLRHRHGRGDHVRHGAGCVCSSRVEVEVDEDGGGGRNGSTRTLKQQRRALSVWSAQWVQSKFSSAVRMDCRGAAGEASTADAVSAARLWHHPLLSSVRTAHFFFSLFGAQGGGAKNTGWHSLHRDLISIIARSLDIAWPGSACPAWPSARRAALLL